MTASGEPDNFSPCCDGRVFRFGRDWAVCGFRLPTSLPIPLAIMAPGEIALETWAFAGMTGRAEQPTCLLMMRVQGAAARTALEGRTRLVVATHFYPVTVTTGPAEPADTLPPEDRAVLTRAVLSAMTPRNAAFLADPVTLLASTLRALPVPEDGPEVTVAGGGFETCRVSGTDVPDYIVFDAGAGPTCFRVAAARLTFSQAPRTDLDLERLWGPEAGPPNRAFLISDGRFTPARLRMAAL